MRSTKVGGFKLNHVLTAWGHHLHGDTPTGHAEKLWWAAVLGIVLFLCGAGFYWGVLP